MNVRSWLYFVGVDTARSAGLRMFPEWARLLGHPETELRGVDLPLDAPAERYREVVRAIREQPQARGALVTTHKLNLLRAAGDLFDEISDNALRAQEVSCIYKHDGGLIGHAVDPESTQQALKTILGDGYWARRRAHILCLGAGGSAAALLTGFLTRNREYDLPGKFLFVDRNLLRLESLQALYERLPASVPVEFVQHNWQEENDVLLAQLPPGSLVVNATGMGKDLPGSPLTDAGVFPEDGIAWDLNYRGALEFLRQARAQAARRNLKVVDGWELFILGWALVCAAVLDTDPFGPVYAELLRAAEAAR